jgi:hypothetical protein
MREPNSDGYELQANQRLCRASVIALRPNVHHQANAVARQERQWHAA